MTLLADIIRDEIARTGPMPVSRYMDLCLAHPVHGYYITRDPFGAKGDFTTAPEVSQMFGELIGAWMADAWIKMGKPSQVMLLEAGPGRGTLMADALRATRSAPGFHEAVSIHLVETSPVLKERQAVSLSGFSPVWHHDFDTIPNDLPVLFIGNEFLDALPIDQLVMVQGRWMQRCIDVDDSKDEPFCYLARMASDDLIDLIPPRLLPYMDGDVVEVSKILINCFKQICFRILNQKGAGLFVDYGYRYSNTIGTLQALHKHRSVSIFHAPGETDITFLINFEDLSRRAMEAGLSVFGPVTQGKFLTSLGIHVRADMLKSKASDYERQDIDCALGRLVSPEQMGELFKVMGVCSDPSLYLEGFNHRGHGD